VLKITNSTPDAPKAQKIKKTTNSKPDALIGPQKTKTDKYIMAAEHLGGTILSSRDAADA
jgi:hypothetical protein